VVLAVSSHAALMSACLSGVVYLSVIGLLIAGGYYRLPQIATE
jgi:hypothetical protein